MAVPLNAYGLFWLLGFWSGWRRSLRWSSKLCVGAYFEKEVRCSGWLDFRLVSVVGRGSMVIMRDWWRSLEPRFFSSRFFLANFSMYPSDDLNLFARVTVSPTARRKFCSDTHVWVAFYLYMQEYLRKKTYLVRAHLLIIIIKWRFNNGIQKEVCSNSPPV